MKLRTFLLGALVYLVATFPLAFTWHLVAFKKVYAELGYFDRGDPIVALGFLTILLQGLILSNIYPLFRRGGRPIREGLKFGLLMGSFLWSSQVLADAAKHHVPPVTTWFVIETAYFAIQFSLVGLAMGWVHRRAPSGSEEELSHGL